MNIHALIDDFGDNEPYEITLKVLFIGMIVLCFILMLLDSR